jgi:uncharacterized protein
MLRIVIDTNVFVSAMISRQGKPAELIDSIKNKEFILFTSIDILKEIEEVLQRPKFRKYIYSDESKQMLQTIRKNGLLMPGNIQVSIFDDPKDNKFLACCEECLADYLVSGDDDLLRLKNYKQTDIISVETFLRILSRYSKP